MRCCIATWEGELAANTLPTEIGSTLDCKYEKRDNPTMRLAADDVWEWNSPFTASADNEVKAPE